MNTEIDKKSGLKLLEGEELSAIVFVRDYLQLQFDGPVITAYVWPSIHSSQGVIGATSLGYRDALCERIGKTISSTTEQPTKTVALKFSDGTTLEFRLDEVNCPSPERLLLIRPEGTIWNVWRFRGE